MSWRYVETFLDPSNDRAHGPYTAYGSCKSMVYDPRLSGSFLSFRNLASPPALRVLVWSKT